MKSRIRGRAWSTRAALLVLVLLMLALRAVPAGAQQRRGVQDVCSDCHAGMSRAGTDRALAHADSMTCLTCHHLGFSNDPGTVAARREAVCRGCHEQVAPAHDKVRGGAVGCAQCHNVHEDAPLAQSALPSARCLGCHEKPPHTLHAKVASKAPECSDCHTLHGGSRLRAADAQTSAKCAACHTNAHPSHTANASSRCTSCHALSVAAGTSMMPVGAKLTDLCNTCHMYVAPVHPAAQGTAKCNDCHSYADDAALPAAAVAISKRCGACHEAEMKQHRSGGHAAGLATNVANPDLPNCLTCHYTHKRTTADLRLAATARCVRCHSDERIIKQYDLPRFAAASYNDDFHGATAQFLIRDRSGKSAADVMTCADCHGAHAVAWRDDARLEAVCVRCHEGGSVKLAGAWLGHTPPGPRNQVIIWLVRLFYYVLIPFVLIGLAMHILFHLIDQRRKGARLLETHGIRRLRARLSGKKLAPEPTVIRFSRLERLEHLGSMLTFMVLLVTGLPQTRPDLAISHNVIDLLGGIELTRLIHRIAGFTFVALLVRHVAHAIIRALREHRMPVMAFSVQDFRDTIGTVRHFLTGAPRPKAGKFDFSEKFEYWGLFMGGTLMSVTGVALVFPELITQVLPGIVIAAFRVAHGLEATFAFFVIALWHSYGVILRPEVFPLDTSIFTGRMSLHRLEEEHRLEYERLFPHEIESPEADVEKREELVEV